MIRPNYMLAMRSDLNSPGGFAALLRIWIAKNQDAAHNARLHIIYMPTEGEYGLVARH